MSHLDLLKQTFDTIGVPYVVEDAGDGYMNLYTCSKEEMKQGRRNFRSDTLFEFRDGELASSP